MNNVQRKAFVIQENPRLNYKSLEDWGEIEFITQSYFATTEQSTQNSENMRAINSFLREYIAGEDYIVIYGSSPSIFAVALAMGAKFAPDTRHKVLRWSTKNNEYYEAIVNLSSMGFLA
ncbi:MAG: hypothetical protein R8M45_06590 [Ghiorsea sp.]